MREYTNAREDILKAAEQLMVQEGVQKLTIAGVAAFSGISKGGIFYHFPSKNTLIAGMVERLAQLFQQLLNDELTADPEPHGRFTRAYARSALRMTPASAATTTALIAGIANDPALLQPLLDLLEAWAHRTEAELDLTTATLIRLTVHGIWFNHLFGASTPAQDTLRHVVERLVAMTYSSASNGS